MHRHRCIVGINLWSVLWACCKGSQGNEAKPLLISKYCKASVSSHCSDLFFLPVRAGVLIVYSFFSGACITKKSVCACVLREFVVWIQSAPLSEPVKGVFQLRKVACVSDAENYFGGQLACVLPFVFVKDK